MAGWNDWDENLEEIQSMNDEYGGYIFPFDGVVQLLLQSSADVNAQDDYYDTALQAATKPGASPMELV